MWVLYFYIMVALGMPEQRYKAEEYATYELCTEAKINVWKKMNSAYPLDEQKLYRFDCALKTDDPKLLINERIAL